MLRSSIAASAVCLCVSSLGAQQAPADPDIYLLSLSANGGKVSFGKPVNITNRKGYDNQPAFSPSGKQIYFTSTRDDGQSDIYSYNIASKQTDRLTKTAPESEYSATVMPSRERLSVVRVEKDSTQRLWSFALNGSDDRLVIPGIKPVGYHAWIDPFHLALFVLGSPNALVLYDTRTRKADTLARDIGRSLMPLPSGRGFTYLSHRADDWMLTEVRLAANGTDSVRYTKPIVALPKGMDYVAWVGGGLIGGNGPKLYSWKSGGEWTEIADLSSDGITKITRLAVSPDHQRLAIVAEHTPPTTP